MTENMKKLLELASEDKKFAKEIQAADKEALIRLAKAHGIQLTEEDFQKSQNELSDDELNAVAGGLSCSCEFVGIGENPSESEHCACALYGMGHDDSGQIIWP